MRNSTMLCRICLLIACCITLIVVSCSDEKTNTTGPSTQDTPQLVRPTPAQGSVDVPLTCTLRWSRIGAASDSVKYNIYLGTSNPPPRIVEGVVDTFCNIGPLMANLDYQWCVESIEANGDTIVSPVWDFATIRGQEGHQFPIDVGNSWTYNLRSYAFNICPACSLTVPELTDTVSGTGTITIADKTVLHDSIACFVFLGKWSGDDGSTYTWLNFKGNTNNGLYWYGYAGDIAWQGPPKKSVSGVSYEFKGRRFSSLRELSDFWQYPRVLESKEPGMDTTYEQPPVTDIAYPVSLGKTWTFRTVPVRIEKDVVGTQAVRVPAGVIFCHEIAWSWDFDNDHQWDDDLEGFDYLADIGIAKRVWIIHDISVFGVEGELIGTFDMEDDYELTSFDVPKAR